MIVALLALTLPACETDTGCKDDFDCTSALVCKVSTGKCELFVCNTSDDCADGKSCSDNVCE